MRQFNHGNRSRCKIKPADVVTIRELYAKGASQRELGEIFNLSTTQVGRITRGESWREYGGQGVTESELMHKAALAGSPTRPEEDEQLAIAKSIEKFKSMQKPNTSLPPDVASRARGYGAQVPDESTGEGLSKLNELAEVKVDEQKLEDELNNFLGDSK